MAKRKLNWYQECIKSKLKGEKCESREKCKKAFKVAVKFCKTRKR